MPVVLPPLPRHLIEDLGETLKITIPSRKNWIQIVWVGFWLVVFGLVLIIVIFAGVTILLAGRAPQFTYEGPLDLVCGSALGLVWFGGILTVVGFMVYGFLWNLTGKDVLEVSPHSLIVRHQILGVSQPKEYLTEHIKDLRASPAPSDIWREWPFVFRSGQRGCIKFDYGAKTYCYSAGEVDEAEAKQILAAIQQRFPQYRS